MEPTQSNGSDGWGIDRRLEDRPGVPMERVPKAAAAELRRPTQQEPKVPVLVGSSHGLTPVFGSAQPPHGLSGRLRRRAYRIPEHAGRHWALLMVADQVDVAESWVREQLRRRPLVVTGAVVAFAAYLLRRR